MEKIIDYRLYNPATSLLKLGANEKAKFKTVSCGGYDRCEAYKKGECTMFGAFTQKCPYGYMTTQTGYTKRSSKYAEWIRQKESSVRDIEQLKSSSTRLFTCGDYVYFNFPHWHLGNVPEKYSGNFFKDVQYIESVDFTPSFVYNIITARPHAMMGGEITSYQKEVVPDILLALKSNMPELLDDIIADHPEITSKIGSVSVVGKQAKANTLKNGCTYFFERYGNAVWDGECFSFEKYTSAFTPIKGECSAMIRPLERESLKIQNEDQVDENTIFV